MAVTPQSLPRHFRFHALPGFFTEFSEECKADRKFHATTQPLLGLIDRRYDTDTIPDPGVGSGHQPRKPWDRFRAYVEHLNETSPEEVKYKVLYLTRHGLGYHNLVHAKVGDDAWNNHWSRLEGDSTLTWADSLLSPEGVAQAQALSAFFLSSHTTDSLPLPQSLYTSPLTRCLETTRLAFAPLMREFHQPFRPVIKELLREQMTDHTCDRRSPRSKIVEKYPEYELEDGFTEEDELWRADRWEPLPEHLARKQKVLEEIFAADNNVFISLTVHSFAIAVIMMVCGMTEFRVGQGSSLALLVRAEAAAEAPNFAGKTTQIEGL